VEQAFFLSTPDQLSTVLLKPIIQQHTTHILGPGLLAPLALNSPVMALVA
jgi:hypothetical protein